LLLFQLAGNFGMIAYSVFDRLLDMANLAVPVPVYLLWNSQFWSFW